MKMRTQLLLLTLLAVAIRAKLMLPQMMGPTSAMVL